MTHNTREIEEMKDKVREWCQQNCIVGTYIGTLHEIVENWHHQELQKAQNCYCKDKAVIELIEENKKDCLREERVRIVKQLKLDRLQDFTGKTGKEVIDYIIIALQSELDQPTGHTCSPYNGYCQSGHTNGVGSAGGAGCAGTSGTGGAGEKGGTH